MSASINKQTIKKIKELRQFGWSLPEIHRELKIGYGTVYRNIKDVTVLPQYKKIWKGKRGGSIKRQLIAEEKALGKAKQLITNLTNKEKLIFLSALYWGEGSKLDFGLINSDPELIRLFIKYLRQLFGYTNDDFRITIRIYDDLDKNECLNYWSKITEIPIGKFINVNILKGKKIGKLKYGMCRVRVKKGGNLLKYIKAIYKRVQELN